jgi:hypothetical protein
MSTIPPFIDLNDIAVDTPIDLICGRVFHIFAYFNQDNNYALMEFTAEEGRGKKFNYKLKGVKSLKDLAEKLRLALFSINCDLSWSGRTDWRGNTIFIEAANERNYKTKGNFNIACWTLNQVEWVV